MSVYEFANKMTEKEANNVIAYWEDSNSEKLEMYRSLVSLGDSKNLAVATVMMRKKSDSDLYMAAYES